MYPGFSLLNEPVESPRCPGMTRQENRIGQTKLVHQPEGKIHAIEMIGLVADGRQALEFAQQSLQIRGTDLSSQGCMVGVEAIVSKLRWYRLVGKQSLFGIGAVEPNVADDGILPVGFHQLQERVAGERVPGLLHQQGDRAHGTRVRNLTEAGPKILRFYGFGGRFGPFSDTGRELGKAVKEGQQKQPCREDWSHTVFVLFNKYAAAFKEPRYEK